MMYRSRVKCIPRLNNSKLDHSVCQRVVVLSEIILQADPYSIKYKSSGLLNQQKRDWILQVGIIWLYPDSSLFFYKVPETLERQMKLCQFKATHIIIFGAIGRLQFCSFLQLVSLQSLLLYSVTIHLEKCLIL